MIRQFYPSYRMDSAYGIDYQEWYLKGIRGIIFDIDNTLVEHGAAANEKAVALFKELHRMGYRTMLLSNNKETRGKPFADAVHSDYIFKGDKPALKGYQMAMEKMETTPETTLFVGDQLFTDVWGANRTGIISILTNPINPKEEIQIVLKRYLEKIVLHFYEKQQKAV